MRHMAKRVCGMTGEATPAQINYASKIHEVTGKELPKDQTKQEYGDYISRYVNLYMNILADRPVGR